MASKRRDGNTLDHRQEDTPNSNKNNHGHSSNNNNDKPESPWNRIQTSAKTLMQDALTRPSGAVLGADLAQALNDNGKISSSSAYSSSFSSASLSSLGLSNSTYSTYFGGTRASDGSLSSFRSVNSVLGGEGGFGFDQDSFQDVPHHYEEYPDIQDSQVKGKGKAQDQQQQIQFDNITMMMNMHNFSDYEIAWINATRVDASKDLPSKLATADDNRIPPQQQSLYKDAENDGDAVVALLSDPFFQPGYMPINHNNDPSSWNDYDEEMTMTDDGYLTTDEIKMIDSFRLQSERQPHSGRINSKSLIPDIDMFLAQNDNTDTTTRSNLRDNVLSRLPGAEDWVRVDERYHDEVWGYLRPALEAASAELEEREDDIRSQVDGGDGPAVRRLKMILRHMTT